MRILTSLGPLARAPRILLASLLAAALAALPAPPVRAAADPIEVTYAFDASTRGTLRSAILAANEAGGGTIVFDEGLAGETITLGSALPVITAPLTIDATALSEPITISGDGKVRVLESAGGVSLALRGLAITGGQTVGDCAGILAGGELILDRCTVVGNHAGGEGGGVCALAAALVHTSTISDNTAKGDAGGIRAAADLILTLSTVSGNSSQGFGGGIFADGDLDMTLSTVSGNSAGGPGGGVLTLGAASVERSTLDGNEAADVGGALLAWGAVEISNSTLAANTARGGGAVSTMGEAAVLSSTFYQNQATEGGAHLAVGGDITLANNILAGGTGLTGDCWWTNGTSTLGANLVQSGDCGAAVAGDPLLGPLGDYGGTTRTFSLLRGSPAVDAGDACPATDQRGMSRPAGAGCDLGAFEARMPWALTNPPPPTAVDGTSATVGGHVRSFDGTAAVSCDVGVDTDYGASVQATPAEVTGGEEATPVSCTFTGLTPNTTYHYRVVAAGAGGTADGGDWTFTTTLLPPAAVTGAATQVTAAEATVHATVNASNATTHVWFDYGPTTAYGRVATAQPATVTGVVDEQVSATLTGLEPSTTYHYRVWAGSDGGATEGGDATFTTAPALPLVETLAAEDVTLAGARLRGSVDPQNAEAEVFFDYGPATGYGETLPATPAIVTGSSATEVSLVLDGLSAATTYHYRLRAVSAAGTAYGEDRTFTTLAPLATITGLAVTDIQQREATVHALVNAHGFPTNVRFEYGVDGEFDAMHAATPGLVTVAEETAVSARLVRLLPGTTYQFRVMAGNAGGAAYSAVATLTTLPEYIVALPVLLR